MKGIIAIKSDRLGGVKRLFTDCSQWFHTLFTVDTAVLIIFLRLAYVTPYSSTHYFAN